MKVLLVGSGAREHAIAWKLGQSRHRTELFVAPGNAGTAAIAVNLPILASDVDGICEAAREHDIDLVVVGPEDPLARGLVDALTELGIAAFGPTRCGTDRSIQAFSKRLLQDNDIPTAPSITFDNRYDAQNYARSRSGARGEGRRPAAGKGVLIGESPEEAYAPSTNCGRDPAWKQGVGAHEERLSGRSYPHAFTDGVKIPMPFACDYKRIGDGSR
jgi:phosphoribosylamine--glycine ligase